MALRTSSMFSEELFIMDRRTQVIAGQVIQTWSKGAKIDGELSISNMQSIRLAEAQGVKALGTLLLELDSHGRDKYPVGVDTHLFYPKGGHYVRIADPGVVESGAGAGIINKRQYACEGMTALPR